MDAALVYSLTAAGKAAVSGKDSDATLLPLEFRRLLGLIDLGGHVEVLRGRLRRFPDRLIEEWLRELAELKLIAPAPATTLEDVTFSGLPVPLLPPIPDDAYRWMAARTPGGAAPLGAPDAHSPTSCSTKKGLPPVRSRTSPADARQAGASSGGGPARSRIAPTASTSRPPRGTATALAASCDRSPWRGWSGASTSSAR